METSDIIELGDALVETKQIVPDQRSFDEKFPAYDPL